jgi:L-glyceraldehyde 3-phosphate reductase
MKYLAAPNRYESMSFARCGASGLKLPAISLGLWHNFGGVDVHEVSREMVLTAFDHGITHLDLANNYGPPPGSAERTLGRILAEDLGAWRDELIISTKAGYRMWEGPYGEWGSRKSLLSSLDQSLRRMGLDYVDIFYSHRFDPETPLEETMGALAHAVRSGKALYAGISNYGAEQTKAAVTLLREMGTPCLIHQVRYNLLERGPEDALFPVLQEEKVGAIVFCPLAQGLLTNRYLAQGEGVPADSRAAKAHGFLQAETVEKQRGKLRALAALAEERGQTLAQMALAWTLRHPAVTSTLIGASRPTQILENLTALSARDFSSEELAKLDAIWKLPEGN